MGVTFENDLMCDRRLQGRAKRLTAHGAQIKQAEPLTVERMAKLVCLVASGSLGLVDRYLLGGLLFAIFSRSRWSDLKNLQSIWIVTRLRTDPVLSKPEPWIIRPATLCKQSGVRCRSLPLSQE